MGASSLDKGINISIKKRKKRTVLDAANGEEKNGN